MYLYPDVKRAFVSEIYDHVIAAYDAASHELAARYDALPAGAVFGDIQHLFPDGGIALDIGAGSGRDARWLASLGFEVVAVEPAAGFRTHASATPEPFIRWLDDRLPALDRVHRLALSFDLITLSAVWQHVSLDDRPRAFRKLATLLKPGGILAMTLRSGPAPFDRPMFPTSASEVESLAVSHGMEVLKVSTAIDLQDRSDVTWTSIVLRMPDDGTGALPLVRGIVLGDEKSSTYKLGLLRAIARIADQAPAAAVPAADQSDAVQIPLGLVGLFWVRMYLPLVRMGLPQAPRNHGPDGLGFAKAGFRQLIGDDLDPSELRVGAIFGPDRAQAILAAVGEAVSTIIAMPANFTRFPASDKRVFDVARKRQAKCKGLSLDLPSLLAWGTIVVPGHLWRALSRFGAWIEPMLIAEWGRLSRRYAERMSIVIPPGAAEAALGWRESFRTTAIARQAAERVSRAEGSISCVWTGQRVQLARLDIDHCLPWSAWPCGDLWNLAPCDRRVNQHEKRDRLPSAQVFTESRERIIGWWQAAYLSDEALALRFGREVSASLPVNASADLSEIYSALDWRRLRLLQDQQVPQWWRHAPHTNASIS